MNTNPNSRVPRGIVGVRADAEGAPNVKALVEELNKAFAAFKEEHTKQLDEVKKGTADALQALKVDKINADIDRLQAAVDEANLKIAAGEMGAGNDRVQNREHTDAYNAFVRKGDVNAILTSMNEGTSADGGYLAPVEWDRTITDKLVQVSPMRQICGVQQISTGGFSKLFNKHGTASGWVGETAARPQTQGSQFATLSFAPGEIYANVAASQTILDDALINLEGFISSEVQTEFARAEGAAFVSGDGSNKPFGFLTYVTGATNAAKHPFGAIGVTATGTASVIKSDDVLSLVYSLPSAFTGNARFVMNRNTQGALRKLKDGQNNYLWQPSYVAGQPASLAGYPITEVPDMPDIADSALPIAFGDFRQGYLIVEDRKSVV